MHERVHARTPESAIPEVQTEARLDAADKDDQEAADLARFTSSEAIQPPCASSDHFLRSPHASDVDEAGEPYPPWINYPNMPRTSSGWRQGEGEECSAEFHEWLRQQSGKAIEAYRLKYPSPPEWANVWPRRQVAADRFAACIWFNLMRLTPQALGTVREQTNDCAVQVWPLIPTTQWKAA